MLFKKTLTVLIIFLLFNQPAFAYKRVGSIREAQEYLSTEINEILTRKVEIGKIKSNARIGIKGILYKGKHSQLSEKIEDSLSRRFTNDSNFDVYERSRLMERVKNELEQQHTDFYQDSFDAIPVGQFRSVEVLITGKIDVSDDGATIAVVAMDVKTNLKIAHVGVELPKSVADNFLSHFGEGRAKQPVYNRSDLTIMNSENFIGGSVGDNYVRGNRTLINGKRIDGNVAIKSPENKTKKPVNNRRNVRISNSKNIILGNVGKDYTGGNLVSNNVRTNRTDDNGAIKSPENKTKKPDQKDEGLGNIKFDDLMRSAEEVMNKVGHEAVTAKRAGKCLGASYDDIESAIDKAKLAYDRHKSKNIKLIKFLKEAANIDNTLNKKCDSKPPPRSWDFKETMAGMEGYVELVSRSHAVRGNRENSLSSQRVHLFVDSFLADLYTRL